MRWKIVPKIGAPPRLINIARIPVMDNGIPHHLNQLLSELTVKIVIANRKPSGKIGLNRITIRTVRNFTRGSFSGGALIKVNWSGTASVANCICPCIAGVSMGYNSEGGLQN